jgi:dolichol-phosphate mannosyltransferase
VVWVLATELAIISNYTLNNIWTFKDQEIKGLGSIVKKFLQFNLTSIGALIIQSVAGPIGTSIVGKQYDFIVLGVVVVFLVLPYNYLMYTKVVWKK